MERKNTELEKLCEEQRAIIMALQERLQELEGPARSQVDNVGGQLVPYDERLPTIRESFDANASARHFAEEARASAESARGHAEAAQTSAEVAAASTSSLYDALERIRSGIDPSQQRRRIAGRSTRFDNY